MMGGVATARMGDGDEDGQILERPKGFYISRRLDRRLDQAVAYLREQHGIRKVDRSVLVNALLDRQELWTPEALDQVVDRVVAELTGRLMRQAG